MPALKRSNRPTARKPFQRTTEKHLAETQEAFKNRIQNNIQIAEARIKNLKEKPTFSLNALEKKQLKRYEAMRKRWKLWLNKI